MSIGRKACCVLLLILGMGIFLRWALLFDQGFLHPDQATYASLLRYRDGTTADSAVFFARPALYWTMAAVAKGIGWTPWVGAAVSATLGSLTLLCVAAWALRMGGCATVLVACGLVAFSTSHVVLSRIGIGSAESVFFATASWLLYAGTLRERQAPAASSPIPLGPLLAALGLGFILLSLLKGAWTALYASRESWRGLLLESAVALQVGSWVLTLLAIGLLQRWSRAGSGQGSPRLVGAGLLAGTAVLWHYTALGFMPLSLALGELSRYLTRRSWREALQRGTRWGVGFALPILLAQGIGFPNRMYWKELAAIVGSNAGVQELPSEPAYYAMVLWTRDGPCWALIWLAGLFLGVPAAIRHRHLEALWIGLTGVAIFGWMSLSAAMGGLMAGRGIAPVIPPVALLTGWMLERTEEDFRRRPVAAPALLLALACATAWPHLWRVTRANAGFGAAAATMNRIGTEQARIGFLKSPSEWAFHLGPKRIMPLVWPLPLGSLAQPVGHLPDVRFAALDRVTAREVEWVVPGRRPIAVIPNPQELLPEILCDVGYGTAAWRPTQQTSWLGQILIFDMQAADGASSQ